MKVEKKCIFCGESPNDKTKEHVIPKWLLSMTGDPKRKFYLGSPGLPSDKTRTFSADQFVFPACNDCNYKYSEMEGIVKNIFTIIDKDGEISANEINILLSWFDKVRIGLWLGFRYLEKNFMNIIPNFYINQRMSISDRVLLIYKLDLPFNGLNTIGNNFPIFMLMPSVFTIIVNGIVFINASTDSLISRRLGFPYATKKTFDSNNITHLTLVEGLNRVINPVLKVKLMEPQIAFYQPILRDVFDKELINDYVEKHFLDAKKRIGGIYTSYNNNYKWLCDSKDKIYLKNPKINQKLSRVLFKRINFQTLELQQRLLSELDIENTDQAIKKMFETIIIFQKKYLSAIKTLDAFETLPLKSDFIN